MLHLHVGQEAAAARPGRVVDVERERAEHRRALVAGVCDGCGVRSTPGGATLKVCSACDSVAYCGADCQKRAWKEHKQLCKALREMAASAAPPAGARFTNENVARAPLQPPSPPLPAARCDGCGAVEGGGGGGGAAGGAVAAVPVVLASCACNTAVFCGRACQAAAWPAHKAACAAARKKAPPPLDWSIGDYAGSDLLTFARTTIAGVDNAHEMLQAFCDFSSISFAPPAGFGFEGAGMKADVLTHAPKPLEHAIYLMSLGAIAYSLVFETLGGSARVYLCFMGSYTVGQWLAPQPPPAALPQMRGALARAHSRWGGGRFLSLTELANFCDALTELQAASEAASNDLLERHPLPVVRRAQLLFDKNSPRAEPPLSRWVIDVQRANPTYPGNITIFFPELPEDGHCFTVSMPPLRVSTNSRHVGEDFSLTMSPAVSARFVNAHLALCGVLPTAESVLTLLFWRCWKSVSVQTAWRATAAIMRKGALETGEAGGGGAGKSRR